MARQYVYNGQKIKCSFGKGPANLIANPKNIKISGAIAATDKDVIFERFGTCTCPKNTLRQCVPLLNKWKTNTVTENVKNGSSGFLLSSSQTTCKTYPEGIVQIDLEDISESEKHDNFANKNPEDSEQTDVQKPSETDKKKKSLDEYSTEDFVRPAQKAIDNGEEVITDESKKEQEAFWDNAGKEINRQRTSAQALDNKSENPDPSSRAQWARDLEAGMPQKSVYLEAGESVEGYFKRLGGYGWGAAKEGFYEPVVGGAKLVVGVATSVDDMAAFAFYRDPRYLAYLNWKDTDAFYDRLAQNELQNQLIKEQIKNLPSDIKQKYVDDYTKLNDVMVTGDDFAAGEAAGQMVVKTIVPISGVLKKGAKLFDPEFLKNLNLKTAWSGVKGEIFNQVTGNIYGTLPYAKELKHVWNTAKTSKERYQQMREVMKAFNEGKDPTQIHKTNASPETPKQKPEETTDGKANNPENSQNGSQNTNKNSVCKGDPVDVITGVNIYDYVDFEIPGNIPISWKRIWYSDSAYKGPLGHGVHHNYDIHLTTRPEDILLTLGDGRLAFFSLLNNEKKSEFNRTEKLQLTYINSSTYHLYDYNDQLTYVLTDHSRTYKISKIIKDGQTNIQFNYQDDYLDEIVDTANRKIKIHYDTAQRIIEITQHHRSEKRTLVTYGYNEAGDLAKITDASGKSVIAVYKNHLMVSKTHREGATCYWEYESYQTGARCTRTWLEGGTLDYKFKYYEKHNEVRDSYGNRTIYHHENNIPVKIIDPLDGITINEYNQFGELIKTIDQEGLQTQYTYDTHGNQTSVRYPDGAEVESSYDDKGNLLLQTSPEGGIFSRFFKNNKLNTIMYPDQTMQTFEYNEHGLISKIADANENLVQLFYDNDHNLNRMISPNGEESFWEYDAWGRCIKTINPAKHQQQFSYDPLGNLSTIRLPDKNKIQLEYDSYGRVRKAIDNGRILTYEYTSQGNLKSREQDGRKVLFRYDKEEQLIGLINEHKESYHFTRDALGNIIREEGFDQITRNFIRDKAGKIIKEEKSNHKFSVYEYDKGGRVSRIEYHDDSWATFDYNKDGLLTQAVNPNSIVKINRDEAGRVISEEQDGHTISFSYNDKGQQSKTQSSLGASIRLKYTELGEVSSVKAKNHDNNIWKANFKYNSLGMETERSLPGGIKTNWSYDQAGRHKQQIVQKREVETRRRTYTWDVNHKLKKIVDNLAQGIVNFDYDDFNNLAWAQYEDKSYDYKLPDEVGNLYRTKTQKDRTYGANGQLLTSGNKTYEYDDEGNLIKKSSPKGTWKYDWNGNGMLKSIYRPDRSVVEMEYDALGRRTTKISKQHLSKKTENNPDLITRFVWNGNVLLHEWHYNLKNKPKLSIDASGLLSKDKKEPIENLITWVFDQGGFKPAAKITENDTYSIITDHLGTPIEMYNSNGEKTWHAEYDIYGKIRNLVTGSLQDCPFRFQGQYEDSEIDLYYNRFRYYNPEEGTYISQDPIRLAGNNPTMYAYTYDSNAWVDPFGLDTYYQLLDDNGNVVYHGITKRDVQIRVGEHIKDGKIFSQISYLDDLTDRRTTRNLEGSALYHEHVNENNLLLNRRRTSNNNPGFYHGYNPDKLNSDEVFFSEKEMEEQMKNAKNGRITDTGKIKPC
ncbi:DUF6531 domain-containing protein [Aquimarina sp. AD1]|uniref:DUF6531 domain-containing protein n=1 Tax=Aquimarina sp. (strain AD1) TaxID=1714848 RepID=UPI001314C73F|nr:DUF6531 domain-containing protein [Aquimarina sp. AD1]